MIAPDCGTWTYGLTLTGTSLHVRHIERDDPGLVVPYWHNQHLLITELDLSLARGLRPGLGMGLNVPFRVVRDRIQFEDLEGQPYVPPNPDTHHRNETLNHVADPQVSALFAFRPGPWTLSAGLGTTVPIGKTEPNPFELGRFGLPHQHIQFGTGTWDPVANVMAARALGGFGVNVSASGKLSFYANTHGYQAGDRFEVAMAAAHRLGSGVAGSAGWITRRRRRGMESSRKRATSAGPISSPSSAGVAP